MKKWMYGIGITIGIIVLGSWGTYALLNNANEYEKEQANANELPNPVETAKPDKPEEGTKEEIAEQTAFIGGIKYDTGLTTDSYEGEVIEVMHKMTHQKVRSAEKWGAIPMSENTINQVIDVLSQGQFNNKDELLEIMNKWKNGNFTQIDLDHNYFWNLQGGTVGKAYGTLNPEEEAEFIKNNF